jgi:hypothetical protein
MRSRCRCVSILTVCALWIASTPADAVSLRAIEEEPVAVLVAVGPGDLRFEIVGRDGPTPVLRVSFSDRTDDMPLTSEDLQALDAYIEESGTTQLTEAQVEEFLLRVQSTIDSTDSSTPCSPEDFDGCYDQGVEECGHRDISGGIGGSTGARLAPRGVGGILGTAAGAILANWVSCNVAVWIGCSSGCQSGGSGCYMGSCYEGCPENTQPTGLSCRINGRWGECCSWNGPYIGEDTCVPPAICYDDACMGCPDSTVPGDGDCEANSNVPCGSCCIPTGHP